MKKSKLMILTRAYSRGIGFWQQFGLSDTKSIRAEQNPLRRLRRQLVNVLLMLLLLVALASVAVMLVINFLQIERIGAMLGINGLSVLTSSVLAALILFLLATYTAGSTLFKAADLKFLVTLPVRADTIFLSRILLHYRTNVIVYWALMLPSYIAVGIVHGLSVQLIVNGIILLLTGPVLPLSCSALFSRLFAKNKSRVGRYVELVAFGLLIVSLAVLQGLMTRWARTGFLDIDPTQILASLSTMADKAISWLPLSVLQTRMIVSEESAGMGPLVATILHLASAGIATFFILRIAATDYVSVLNFNVSTQQSVKKRKGSPGKIEKQRSMLSALITKEFAVINGHNAFMFELYAEAFVPIILIAVYSVGGLMTDISSAIAFISDLTLFPFIFCGILLAVASITMMSSTSISRETPLLDIIRSLPIPTKRHVQAKIAAHLLMFGTAFVFYTVIGMLLLPVGFMHIVWMLPLGAIVMIISSCLGLAIDYMRPMYQWKLPQQAIKQNVNGIIGMVASIVVLGIFGGLAILLVQVLGLSVMLSGFILALLGALMTIPAWKVLLQVASGLYENI